MTEGGSRVHGVKKPDTFDKKSTPKFDRMFMRSTEGLCDLWDLTDGLTSFERGSMGFDRIWSMGFDRGFNDINF